MLKVTTFLILVFGVSLQISAQCSINFKESSRQIFSDAFAEGYFEDFDNDGLDDLLGYTITEEQSNGPRSFQFQYYQRLTNNSFDTTAKSTLITNIGRGGVFAVVGDVNGDGNKDLIVKHNTNPATMSTYLNDGTGQFSTNTTPQNILGEVLWAASDLNGDGKADLITQSPTISYRLAQADNSFGEPVSIGPSVTIFSEVTVYANGGTTRLHTFPLIVEDLDNDGLKDIAFVIYEFINTAKYKLLVLTNNGDLTFTQTNLSLFNNVLNRLKAYDINDDGKKDFISNETPNYIARQAINNGSNVFTETDLHLPRNNRYGGTYFTKDFFVADFDNVGSLDYLFSGDRNDVYYKNQNNETFVETQKGIKKFDHIANLNNDGKDDVLGLLSPLLGGYHQINGENNDDNYYLHTGISFRNNVCEPAGQTNIVDFDGDGNSDIAFWNPDTGIWRVINGTYNFEPNQTTFRWGVGSLGDVPVPNDYDGDGKTDHAIYRKSNGTWWVYRSSDNQAFAINFGITEDKPIPADYDGDGKADFAVFRPSTGDWHFWLSQTNQYKVVHFGASGDKPAPADYDGDGKADISVFRPTTGVWYRFNSADESIFIAQFGISTDILLPGDYNADGRANIAVYRDGTLFILKDDFSAGVVNWGTTGDLPFFDDGLLNRFGVYRSSDSKVYLANSGVMNTGLIFPFETGDASNEIFVSSILPQQ